ncbi:MAG: hypothetical protein COB09_18800 [Thalassobium sp.]|nr:MAG: hypothetical protein COB09_18800 [Thalassobium sp.]
MKKLLELVALCKCSVSIVVNDHKDNYQGVEAYISDLRTIYEEEIEEEILNGMIANDTIVCLRVYPDTPVGFNVAYHYDVDILMDEMIKHLKEEG